MSSGGGGGGDGTQNVYQSNLPEYAQPYFESLMGRAMAESMRPYTPYRGQTVAGQNATQQGALEGFQNYGSSAGANMMQNAGNIAQNAAGSTYTPDNVATNDVTAQQTGVGNFNQAAAQQYMDPYMQSVVDQQKSAALRDYQMQGIQSNSDLVKQGAFGGTRQAIINAEAQRNLNSQLQNIQQTGLSNAFANAQQQFNTDRSTQLASQQANQQAALQAAQGNQQAALQAAQGNQQAGLNAAQLNSQNALSGAQLLGNLGATMGSQQQNALSNIYNIGKDIQGSEQEKLNSAYNQWLNQQNWSQNQLGWLSNILHGTNTGTNSTTTSVVPQTSGLSSLAGLGLTGAGLSG